VTAIRKDNSKVSRDVQAYSVQVHPGHLWRRPQAIHELSPTSTHVHSCFFSVATAPQTCPRQHSTVSREPPNKPGGSDHSERPPVPSRFRDLDSGKRSSNIRREPTRARDSSAAYMQRHPRQSESLDELVLSKFMNTLPQYRLHSLEDAVEWFLTDPKFNAEVSADAWCFALEHTAKHFSVSTRVAQQRLSAAIPQQAKNTRSLNSPNSVWYTQPPLQLSSSEADRAFYLSCLSAARMLVCRLVKRLLTIEDKPHLSWSACPKLLTSVLVSLCYVGCTSEASRLLKNHIGLVTHATFEDFQLRRFLNELQCEPYSLDRSTLEFVLQSLLTSPPSLIEGQETTSHIPRAMQSDPVIRKLLNLVRQWGQVGHISPKAGVARENEQHFDHVHSGYIRLNFLFRKYPMYRTVQELCEATSTRPEDWLQPRHEVLAKAAQAKNQVAELLREYRARRLFAMEPSPITSYADLLPWIPASTTPADNTEEGPANKTLPISDPNSVLGQGDENEEDIVDTYSVSDETGTGSVSSTLPHSQPGIDTNPLPLSPVSDVGNKPFGQQLPLTHEVLGRESLRRITQSDTLSDFGLSSILTSRIITPHTWVLALLAISGDNLRLRSSGSRDGSELKLGHNPSEHLANQALQQSELLKNVEDRDRLAIETGLVGAGPESAVLAVPVLPSQAAPAEFRAKGVLVHDPNSSIFPTLFTEWDAERHMAMLDDVVLQCMYAAARDAFTPRKQMQCSLETGWQWGEQCPYTLPAFTHRIAVAQWNKLTAAKAGMSQPSGEPTSKEPSDVQDAHAFELEQWMQLHFGSGFEEVSIGSDGCLIYPVQRYPTSLGQRSPFVLQTESMRDFFVNLCPHLSKTEMHMLYFLMASLYDTKASYVVNAYRISNPMTSMQGVSNWKQLSTVTSPQARASVLFTVFQRMLVPRITPTSYFADAMLRAVKHSGDLSLFHRCLDILVGSGYALDAQAYTNFIQAMAIASTSQSKTALKPGSGSPTDAIPQPSSTPTVEQFERVLFHLEGAGHNVSVSQIVAILNAYAAHGDFDMALLWLIRSTQDWTIGTSAHPTFSTSQVAEDADTGVRHYSFAPSFFDHILPHEVARLQARPKLSVSPKLVEALLYAAYNFYRGIPDEVANEGVTFPARSPVRQLLMHEARRYKLSECAEAIVHLLRDLEPSKNVMNALLKCYLQARDADRFVKTLRESFDLTPELDVDRICILLQFAAQFQARSVLREVFWRLPEAIKSFDEVLSSEANHPPTRLQPKPDILQNSDNSRRNSNSARSLVHLDFPYSPLAMLQEFDSLDTQKVYPKPLRWLEKQAKQGQFAPPQKSSDPNRFPSLRGEKCSYDDCRLSSSHLSSILRIIRTCKVTPASNRSDALRLARQTIRVAGMLQSPEAATSVWALMTRLPTLKPRLSHYLALLRTRVETGRVLDALMLVVRLRTHMVTPSRRIDLALLLGWLWFSEVRARGLVPFPELDPPQEILSLAQSLDRYDAAATAKPDKLRRVPVARHIFRMLLPNDGLRELRQHADAVVRNRRAILELTVKWLSEFETSQVVHHNQNNAAPEHEYDPALRPGFGTNPTFELRQARRTALGLKPLPSIHEALRAALSDATNPSDEASTWWDWLCLMCGEDGDIAGNLPGEGGDEGVAIPLTFAQHHEFAALVQKLFGNIVFVPPPRSVATGTAATHKLASLAETRSVQ